MTTPNPLITLRGVSIRCVFIDLHWWCLLFVGILLAVAGCKVSQIESTSRSLNRDLDMIRSPYQYKVSEDEQNLLRVLRKMPLGETAADPVLRAGLEKVIESKLGAVPKIAEIRIFESEPGYRREIWVADHNGTKLAFDIKLRASTRGGVAFTIDGPVEIFGNL